MCIAAISIYFSYHLSHKRNVIIIPSIDKPRTQSLHRPIPAIILIGAQKCGTESLLKTMQSIPEIHAVKRELHYFDECSATNPPHSYNKSLNQFWNISKCRKQKYKHKLKNTMSGKLRKNSSYLDSIYIFEKTPVYIMHPHIAEIVTNEFVKYGTKIFALFRNPSKRLISGLFQLFFGVKSSENYKNKTREAAVEEINKFICVWTAYTDSFKSYCSSNYNLFLVNNLITNKMNALNVELNELYNSYQNGSFYGDVDDILSILNRIYVDVLYWTQNQEHKFGDYRSWLRGQYALQCAVWLHRIRKLKSKKHSFKIIQSEQLFFSGDSFQRTLLYLKCFVHSVDVADDEYDEWMQQCVENNENEQYVRYNINSMTSRHSLDPILQKMLDESYKVSNKWLKLLIDELCPDIVLHGKWKWKLWN